MKQKEIGDWLFSIVVIFFALAVIATCVFALTMARRDIARSKRPIQIDTTKVVYIYDTINVGQILYEDTWGKVLLIKNEDL